MLPRREMLVGRGCFTALPEGKRATEMEEEAERKGKKSGTGRTKRRMLAGETGKRKNERKSLSPVKKKEKMEDKTKMKNRRETERQLIQRKNDEKRARVERGREVVAQGTGGSNSRPREDYLSLPLGKRLGNVSVWLVL